MTVCYNNYFVVISDITSILKEIPTKYELFELLNSISDKWYDIGLSLQVRHNVLKDLKNSQEDDIENLIVVIDNFLTKFVTFEEVITAIEGPIVNDKETADSIRQYLSKGKTNDLLSNEVINSGVQTTTVKCIQFSLYTFMGGVKVIYCPQMKQSDWLIKS